MGKRAPAEEADPHNPGPETPFHLTQSFGNLAGLARSAVVADRGAGRVGGAAGQECYDVAATVFTSMLHNMHPDD